MEKTRLLKPFAKHAHPHERCVANALATAEATCTNRGQRLTKLRRRVLELVWAGHTPVKAYDLLEQLRKEHPGSAPPTVYRALEFLMGQGLVHRIESLNAYVGCGDPEAQHIGQFLICSTCGCVAEIEDEDIGRILVAKAKELGFHVSAQTIEINGVCAECQEAMTVTESA